MQPKSPKWLEDIRSSADFIIEVTEGKQVDDYHADPLLRAAVERHFEIIGEAMNRLARYDPDTASKVSEYSHIISFRNILIHGYDLVDHNKVWKVICDDLPTLQEQVKNLLQEMEEKE